MCRGMSLNTSANMVSIGGGGNDSAAVIAAPISSFISCVHRSSSPAASRSEEHTSELQSLRHLVCRLLLEQHILVRKLHLFRPIGDRSSNAIQFHLSPV